MVSRNLKTDAWVPCSHAPLHFQQVAMVGQVGLWVSMCGMSTLILAAMCLEDSTHLNPAF